MTFEEFKTSLSNAGPPAGLPALLQALWYDAKGNWKEAHNLAQEIESPDGSWVHAYLHRKEGDTSNAAYWYRLAGKKLPAQTLHEEWDLIVMRLLQQKN